MSSEQHETPLAGGMLRVISQWVRDQVVRGVISDGFDDLSPSHIDMFRFPGLNGARASDLAGRMRVSKQAITQLASQLERLGYIERTSDPDDGRARRIVLTETGRAVQTSITHNAQHVDVRLAEEIGLRDFDELREHLRRLYEFVSTNEAG